MPFGTGFAIKNNDAMPTSRISNNNITVFKDKIVIRVTNATISNYDDSGSMKPTLWDGSRGINIVPNSEEDIKIGDIISYKFGNILVAHRVIKRGSDNQGVYFITQGDNNIMNDGKIRFNDIKYVTVGIIW